MKIIKLVLGLFFISNICLSQIRFAQFYSSPLSINPAYTGRFNKSSRIGGQHRREKNERKSIYTFSTIYADHKILNSFLPENETMAIGFSGTGEKSEFEGITNNYLSISFAYQKALDEEGKQQLGIGFQSTLARRKLQKPTYLFEDQLLSLINAGYTSIDVSLLQNNVDISYHDFNAGLVYQGRINAKNYFAISTAIYHITKPDKVFAGGELKIPQEIRSHLAWEKSLTNERKLYSAVLFNFSKKSIQDLLAGINYDIEINKKSQLVVGGWLRKNATLGSAIIPTIGFNFKDFTLNTSYDINVSSKVTAQKGSNEISLIYTNATSRERFLEKKYIKF